MRGERIYVSVTWRSYFFLNSLSNHDGHTNGIGKQKSLPKVTEWIFVSNVYARGILSKRFRTELVQTIPANLGVMRKRQRWATRTTNRELHDELQWHKQRTRFRTIQNELFSLNTPGQELVIWKQKLCLAACALVKKTATASRHFFRVRRRQVRVCQKCTETEM